MSEQKKYKVGGYVKRAKLCLRNAEEIADFHSQYYIDKFANSSDCELVAVYIDITGEKKICRRPQMIRLMKDCSDGKINLIATETKAYLAPNTREFCYWLHFIFNLRHHIDIVTEDADFNINTIQNDDNQREALEKMAEDYIYLNPPDHQKWLAEVVSAITNLTED